VFLQIKLRLLYLSRANLGPLENLYKSYLLKMSAATRGPELLQLFTQCIRDEQKYFTDSPGLALDELASLLSALANPKQVRSTGIENLLQSKEIKKVFMTEQERLLMETAIAYYRDFEL
jgi:hypothetical protein